MPLNLLIATSQLNSKHGKILGSGTLKSLEEFADILNGLSIKCDIYDLPNGSRNPDKASPFSLNNGFAQNTDELNIFEIPEVVQNPSLLKHLVEINNNYLKQYQNNRTISYVLKRSIYPWILNECFEKFQNIHDGQRHNKFKQFQIKANYWIKEYALYEVYKELNFAIDQKTAFTIVHPATRDFIKKHSSRIEYYIYCQFLCYEQRRALIKKLKTYGINLIINLPFGVEFDSADVCFHPEVFDTNYQVGCSPEPEHGYPEQAWGVAVYKEKSEGLKHYLTAKMTWLTQLGNGVFLDHLVGWCGQYIVPIEIPLGSQYPHGHFITENFEARKDNIRWFLEILLKTDLQIKGEIAGDHQRVLATRAVVDDLLAENHKIGAMAIPRWETKNDQTIPLSKYKLSTLVMHETHDTSTILQYLLNQKGDRPDFEQPEKILDYCRRVLGLPFFLKDVPLKKKNIDQAVWEEIGRRLINGVPTDEVIITLSGLISLLSPDYHSTTIQNNINNKPGTSGLVGNEYRNWSYYTLPVELLKNDPVVSNFLKQYTQSKFKPFDYFHYLDTDRSQNNEIEVIYSCIKNRLIVYQNQNNWQVFNNKDFLAQKYILSEIVITNLTESEVWERIHLNSFLALEIDHINFYDLNDQLVQYTYSTHELQNEGLFVKLSPHQTHHFLVSASVLS